MVTYDPSTGTAPITQYGNPVQVASLYPINAAQGVEQNATIWGDSIYESSSQNGSAAGLYNTLITRFMSAQSSTTNNPEADHMRIYDGGHGVGVTVERSKISGTGNWVWASLQGQNQQGDPRGGMLTRFKYTPGDYHISEIPGGYTFMPWFPNFQGVQQESVYGFDWDKDWCVERQFDFTTGNRERYTRRKITDVINGVDSGAQYGQFFLPTNPPTLQGFTTINDTLYRWLGKGNNGSGQITPGDPMKLEAWKWSDGSLFSVKEFPTLAQTNSGPTYWKDGNYEPEGATVYREADGTASLIVGVTVGASGQHRWPIYKFTSIGAA